jgi:hypothetical protein
MYHRLIIKIFLSVSRTWCKTQTCRPTTHDDPTFVVEGVVHYCVANMPGAGTKHETLWFFLIFFLVLLCRSRPSQMSLTVLLQLYSISVPFTSTMALNNATLPYVLALANKGWVNAARSTLLSFAACPPTTPPTHPVLSFSLERERDN